MKQSITTKAFLAFLKNEIEAKTIQAFKKDEWNQMIEFI
jgi:hypothetical protein